MLLVKITLWVNLVITILLMAYQWLPSMLIWLPGLVYLMGLIVIISSPFLGLLWGYRYRADFELFPYRMLWYISGINVILLLVLFVFYYL